MESFLEWRTGLIYTFPVLLKGVLGTRFYDHFMLLSTSIYRLLKEEISSEEIDDIEVALKKFCLQVNQLYGIEHCSFNIHQLTHICDTVRRWGPLWGTSEFPFESNNHYLMRMIQGRRYPALQISKKFTLKKGIEATARVRMQNAEHRVKSLYSRLIHICPKTRFELLHSTCMVNQ
jgi:hypothetical protein